MNIIENSKQMIGQAVKSAFDAAVEKGALNPADAVSVEESVQENAVVLTLHVGENDMGKVIGKQGRIAKAIRTVVKAAASHENKKVTVDIV